MLNIKHLSAPPPPPPDLFPFLPGTVQFNKVVFMRSEKPIKLYMHSTPPQNKPRCSWGFVNTILQITYHLLTHPSQPPTPTPKENKDGKKKKGRKNRGGAGGGGGGGGHTYQFNCTGHCPGECQTDDIAPVTVSDCDCHKHYHCHTHTKRQADSLVAFPGPGPGQRLPAGSAQIASRATSSA